ncbi:acetamidase [Apiospora arundinis]|uniref:amidase n=1 Tax=Apiospora arundinis TaxID=335852 RepID=A0ABR2IRH5_9PEZI
MSDVQKTISGGATWQEVAADRRRHRDASIAKVLPNVALPHRVPHISIDELTITNTEVVGLVASLASGVWSATTVTMAFLRRAGLAQREMTNCITELLPDRALKRAAELDRYWAKHKKPIGPLHGVPISVKEHVAMEGLDLNAGFVSWVGRVADKHALLLQILWNAGAVFYVRTTQPQTLMHLETSSNLYGVTTNPFNPSLTAGGSSGGEGALVGLRGSILGIGTDIGGSIRSPAANNGVFGFKPTSGRLPVLGCSVAVEEPEIIKGTIGPLSTSLSGIRLFMKTAIAGQPWVDSPDLVAMEWKKTFGLFAKKKLKVAVMWNDGVVIPHPPITTALRQIAVELQKSDSVEVVDWEPLEHDRAWSIIAGLYFPDGGSQTSKAISDSGEPWMPLSKWILEENPHVKKHSSTSLGSARAERDAYQRAYAERWKQDADVDVILCPAGPSVAPKLDAARYWGYTAQWNLLDYPAVAFPVNAHVGDGTPEPQVTHTPKNDEDRYNWSQWQQHGAKGYEGAPISLQLVGRRYDDEKLLAALEVILTEAGLPTAVLPSVVPQSFLG